MRLQRESYVYVINLCRKKVATKSRTSLPLPHFSEIGLGFIVYSLFKSHVDIQYHIHIYTLNNIKCISTHSLKNYRRILYK